MELEDFLEELSERLDESEQILLDIETMGSDSFRINLLFRSIHTIKGTAGMYGFDDLVSMTHAVETILDGYRESEMSLDNVLLEQFLHYVDLARKVLAEPEDQSRFHENIAGYIDRLDVLSQSVGDRDSYEDSTTIPESDEITVSKPSNDSIRSLTSHSIGDVRQLVLNAIAQEDDLKINLSEVSECDSAGIHFLCSLVPLFMNKGLSLEVEPIPFLVKQKAFTLGINIENVMKRAAFARKGPSNSRVSDFTITLHATEQCMWDEYISEFNDLVSDLGEDGVVCVEMNTDLIPPIEEMNPLHCYMNSVICVASPLSRANLEKRLHSLPSYILWTLSLTPKLAVRNAAAKSETVESLVYLWQQLFSEAEKCQLAELKKVISDLQEQQKRIAEHGVCVEATTLEESIMVMKMLRGETKS